MSATDKPCRWFHWIGQSLACCDECGKPAWEHDGISEPKKGAGPFSGSEDDWTGRPWAPGQADRIRAKWDPVGKNRPEAVAE